MSDKATKELKVKESGYIVTRSNLKPFGRIVLPAVDELNGAQFADLVAISDALSPDGDDVTAHERIVSQAIIAGRFIDKYGKWEFDGFDHNDFKIATKSPNDLPINFVYWLHGQFKRYVALVTDPNDLAIS